MIRYLHKWLAVLIGLQVLIWVTSGMIISLLDSNMVAGQANKATSLPQQPLGPAPQLVPIESLEIDKREAITSIKLERALSRWLYRITTANGVKTFDAQTGQTFQVDKDQAQQQAQQSYAGNAPVLSSRFLERGSSEVHEAGPVWRVDFDDAVATRVYVSALDGSVVAHRNQYWKLVDTLLMLHFMDYPRAHHFNNPQIIVVGFLAIWLTLCGLILVKRSFTRRDFTWRGLTR